MGKDDGSTTSPASEKLAGLSEQFFQQTDPLRQQFINRAMGLFGVQPKTITRQIAAPAYSQGGQNIIGWAPGGGEGFDSAGRSGGRTAQEWQAAGVNPKTWGFTPIYGAGVAPSQTVAETTFEPTGQPYDVTQNPIYAQIKNAMESQYGTARQNVLSSIPQGGGLIGALTDLEKGRAAGLTAGMGQIYQDELNRAFTLASGGMQTGMSGLGAAGGIQAQLAAANAQQNAAAKSGTGQGLGLIIGSMICWVAIALYGENKKTMTIRMFVHDHQADFSLLGRFCRLYKKHGKTWARWVRRNFFVRIIARMIWDCLYRIAKHG